ncbi:MAG: UDP-N-acetylglucosamine--LPS N-acetylglucosamine transferase [Phycisphaeraceae bacterium]|nr:hypothetical protein [Phycisphaerales bacterium]MCB9860998.1 UDP-N-acetylglucosamine--LPS N-acetylglucosamine transferase [Phycisphaeraceae bacterium]
MSTEKPKRILAIASGGGHWVQMLRLRPAFDGHRVCYATVRKEYQQDIPNDTLFVISDGTRWSKLKLIKMALQILIIILRVRPHVILSTGAAPGYFAFRIGRLFGARTLWIDSIANVEEVSMTCRLVEKHANARLTQWPHLAEKDGPAYHGAVV